MPFFSYKAFDDNGVMVKGFVEVNNIDLAYENIESLGLYLLDVQKSSRLSDLYLKKTGTWGIKKKDIIEFANNLSVMLKAGLPLIMALSDIIETMDNKKFRDRLIDIKRSIELGSGFSIGLSHHKDLFPEIFINLIAIGEETGRLHESLSDVAVHLQRMKDLKSAIVRALIYPVFALLGALCALLFWLVYVLPKMIGLFQSMNIKLPFTTQVIIIASDFTRANWYVFIVLPFIIYLTIKLFSRQERTKYYLDAAQLKIPVIKLIVHNKLLALFSEQLRILLTAGVTIVRSFDIMINVVDNLVFKKALEMTKEDILLGSKIGDALKKHHTLLPHLVFRMVSVGEAAGNLTEQLNYLSEHFLEKLDDISQKIGKMLEPFIIVIIGVIFIVIILGLLSPIYDLISEIGK